MRVVEKHFEVVCPTFFKIRSESQEAALISLNRVHRRKVNLIFFLCKRSLVMTEDVCCNIFESFCNGRKEKNPRRVVSKLVLTELYCACAPGDIVSLNHPHSSNNLVTGHQTWIPATCNTNSNFKTSFNSWGKSPGLLHLICILFVEQVLGITDTNYQPIKEEIGVSL